MSKFIYRLVIVFVLVSVVLAGCAQTTPETTAPSEPDTDPSEAEPTAVPVEPEPTAEPEPEVEQILRIALRQGPETLDVTTGSQHSWKAEYLIYDALIRMGEDGKPVPSLAASWENLDENTWQLKLREGVTFHNGEKFDANAVKFSLDDMLNPDNGFGYIRFLGPIAEVTVVDDYTINIITGSPSATLIPDLIGVLIRPPKYFEEVGREGFAAAPIGTGPYKLVEFIPEESTTLTRYDDHWGGAYSIETIVLKEVPEQSVRMAALEAGEVDIADDIQVDQVQRLTDAGFEIEAVALSVNITALISSPAQREQYPMLTDLRVRQALNYAVNKQELSDAIAGGYGRPSITGFVGPDGFGYVPGWTAYEYDLDKAQQLLDDAGYGDGFEIKLSYPTGRYPFGDEIVEVVASYLAQVGVTMELEAMENAAWMDAYRANELPLTLFAPNYYPTMDASRVLLMCSGTFPRNWAVPDPAFDALYDQQRATLDPVAREPILQAANQYCTEEMAPILWTIFPPTVYAYSSSVHDVGFRSDGLLYLDSAYIE
jgi:peptide/nickel transport system substrate-binding protein